ncbi:sigma-54-dependent Fis family transcriptional regulator [Variovorax sp. NFACC27]|uniref:sigma-54-dependent Fis family transcriptional regulator n=1 Tax=unclassified Variovorax TaxID=663243 RepID=UPI00089BE611|nr:Transcriptional regulator of acetoin/glycerol metabolism [Variovorax sp. NFACC28]SEF91849.1 Transcriptional regulator of acetoin/glycerol metabolism [Variovorax sp. NFACC29]SFB89869.1 Transcriptional regulator of acetoin/glycerol metabolism [Variovorax sp. NFACC26]SFF83927.1 Transcriptional regulator of acetoin/glycerol metabolism [Variovorax sp. NFACC27]
MTSLQSRHIDNVYSIATGAALADPARSLVHKSWARCVRDHGLDPSKPSPARILPAQEVRAHQQQLEHFLRAARSGMEDIYRRVADLGYMVLLTDAEGITVDYIGNPAWDDQLRKAGLYLGADWNEAHAGTCGVGTCLVERQPMTCHQTEHFDATHIALTCTTAPLFDHSGKLTAVLDVSALRSPEAKESQHLVRHLVAIYARMIEDADFLRAFRGHWILRLGSAFGLVDVAGEVMLAFDEGGTVVGANGGARQAFAGRPPGGPVSEWLHMPMDAIWRIGNGGASAMPFAHTVLLPGGGEYHASLLAPRVRRAAAPASATPAPRPSDRLPPLERIAGDDPQMQKLLAQARRLVDRGIHVLVEGETGSGKEVLARALHGASSRAAMPFVAVNCAAIPDSLIESELFGYTPGSFTGGRAKGMKGLIAQADRGTLFLDEIGDMPMALQTRLLRVLSEGEVLPLGAESPQRVDIAVVAATHRHLPGLVASGRFREDLYYRLCGAVLKLPPLRARGDMRYLIEGMFNEEAAAMPSPARLSEEAMQRLLAHDWPGNLRELRNVLRLALALCTGASVSAQDLQLQPRANTVSDTEPDEDVAAEAGRLLDALKRHRWHVARAADELGMSRATAYRHMKRLGIVVPRRG